MNPLDRIAHARVDEAVREGLFDDLALAGQPLPPDDATGVPQELRAAYRMLHGSGHLPEEMRLKKELLTLRDLLAAATDDAERDELERRLAAQTLRFEVLMERRR